MGMTILYLLRGTLASGIGLIKKIFTIGNAGHGEMLLYADYLLQYTVALAELLNLDKSTLISWVNDPVKHRDEDYFTSLALVLELPDWISRILFKRTYMFRRR